MAGSALEMKNFWELKLISTATTYLSPFKSCYTFLGFCRMIKGKYD